MTLSIKVYSDYVCPFCYLAKIPLENAVKGKDVEVEWLPFELRPNPSPSIDPWNDPIKMKTWENVLSPTADKWGVQMKLPRMSPHPNTGMAFEGFQFAKAHGKGTEYHDRVFTAFYLDEKDIGDIDVLTKLAEDSKLDADQFKKALITGKYREQHQAALNHAYKDVKITGVPTLFIGERRIQGILKESDLEQIINQEIAKKNSPKASPVGLSCETDKDCS